MKAFSGLESAKYIGNELVVPERSPCTGCGLFYLEEWDSFFVATIVAPEGSPVISEISSVLLEAKLLDDQGNLVSRATGVHAGGNPPRFAVVLRKQDADLARGPFYFVIEGESTPLIKRSR